MFLLFFCFTVEALIQGAVHDHANVLRNETIKSLNDHLLTLRTSESLYAPCNEKRVPREIGIYVVQEVWENSRELTNDAELERFAKDTHDELGIGDKECHHGLLLFLNLKQRFMHFSTGKGMKQYASDSFLRTVQENMKPLLRTNQLDQALLLGMQRILDHLRVPVQQPQQIFPPSDSSSHSSLWEKIILFALLFFIVTLVVGLFYPTVLWCLVANLGILIWNSVLWMYFTIRNFIQRRRTKTVFQSKIKELRQRFAGVPIHHMTCCICFDDLQVDEKEEEKNEQQLSKLKMLPCNHVFHTACIDVWLKARSTCPLCRKEVKDEFPGYQKYLGMREHLQQSRVVNDDSLFDLWLYHHHPLHSRSFYSSPRLVTEHYVPLRRFDFSHGEPEGKSGSNSNGWRSGGSWNFGGGSSWGGGGVSSRW